MDFRIYNPENHYYTKMHSESLIQSLSPFYSDLGLRKSIEIQSPFCTFLVLTVKTFTNASVHVHCLPPIAFAKCR